jgi:hypothetical protein
MRAILLMLLLAAASRGEGVFGPWKMNSGRSSFPAERLPGSLMVRFEPHATGECLRWTGSSGTEAPPATFAESGQPDGGIPRIRATGDWTRFVRRLKTVHDGDGTPGGLHGVAFIDANRGTAVSRMGIWQTTTAALPGNASPAVSALFRGP